MSKIAVLGEVINITEEDLAFTNEQLERIEELRKRSGTGKPKTHIRKKKSTKSNTNQDTTQSRYYSCGSRNLEEGMPVTVTEQGHTFIGFVTKVHPDRWYPKFDVKTAGGDILKEIDHRCISYRAKDMYSYGGEIPEELTKWTTQHLLNELKVSRFRESDSYNPDDYDNGYVYPSYQIKAELAKRPHIPTKAERKAVINHAKRNKAMKKYEKNKRKSA